MFRLFLLSLSLCFIHSVRADRLSERLSLVLPDDQVERTFVEERLRQLIGELESDRIAGKSLGKQLRWIRQRLGGGYLRKFQSDAQLADLFRAKAYNDVTASLAYALLLDHFAIPYRAVIDHWEVFLLVDPEERPISLRDGSGRADEAPQELAFRQDYVELLNLTALPTQRPRSQADADSLYHLYHYAERELLNFGELAAHYHYRLALHAYRSGAYESATQRLAQARYSDDRPAFDLLEQATYLQLAQGAADSTDLSSLFYLFELWRNDSGNRFIPKALLVRFRSVSDRSIQTSAGQEVPADPLAESLDVDQSFPSFGRNQAVLTRLPLSGPQLETDWGPAEQLYVYLRSRARDFPDWREELRELYYFQRARYYDRRNRDDLVVNYLDSLHRMYPEEPFYRDGITRLSLAAIRRENLENEALAQRIDQLTARYDFIATDPALADILLRDLAKTIRARFARGETTAGESLLVEFRRTLAGFADSPQRHLWILEVYAAASYHYYLLGELRRAKDLLREGLRYAPGEAYLSHRLEVLD